MSVRQMGIVWELDLAPNKRLVLLAYADHADDDGEHVYPSLARVARKTGYSRDQVRRISRELVEDGLMELVEKNPDGNPNGNRPHRYRMTLEGGSKLPPLKPRRKPRDEGGVVANDPSPVGAPMPPEPSLGTVIQDTSSFTKVKEEAGKPAEGKEEDEKPIAERTTKERQSYCVAYLHERLKERGLLDGEDGRPLTDVYKKQLSGELRNHINAGMRHGRILLAIDKIVFRWPEKRLELWRALDDGDELSKRREGRGAEESRLPKMRELT